MSIVKSKLYILLVPVLLVSLTGCSLMRPISMTSYENTMIPGRFWLETVSMSPEKEYKVQVPGYGKVKVTYGIIHDLGQVSVFISKAEFEQFPFSLSDENNSVINGIILPQEYNLICTKDEKQKTGNGNIVTKEYAASVSLKIVDSLGIETIYSFVYGIVLEYEKISKYKIEVLDFYTKEISFEVN